jgi:hypothetical protein
MQTMTTDINQLAWRRELPAMPPCGDLLIQSADGKECHYDAKNGHVWIVQCSGVRYNLGGTYPGGVAKGAKQCQP